MHDSKQISCWCGEFNLAPFSEFYRRCSSCGTLVSVIKQDADFYKGGDTDSDLYGKEYWTKYVKTLGFPDIYDRSREDLCERSLFWLRSILKYRLPPAKSLELGCAHGGSVYLQRLAGYDAVGAEMSPWLCDFAKSTFDVPMLCGDIEDINISPASLDIVILMDVLEHFPEPLNSLMRIVSTLTDDGILVIQTPLLKSVNKSYEQMKADGEMFLLHMKQDEHLYLFSEESIKVLLDRLGLQFVAFEPPIFAYDMFVFASRKPFKINTDDDVLKWLTSAPSRRAVLALLDMYSMLENVQLKLSASYENANILVNSVNDLNVHQRYLLEARAQLNEMRNSLIWKLSAPLRKCSDKLRHLFS